MSGISSHVLDTARGRPAAGVVVHLDVEIGETGLEDSATGTAGAAVAGTAPAGSGWRRLASAATDADGRVAALLPAGTALAAVTYRLTFDTGAWFAAHGTEAFYPRAAVEFRVADPAQHHHVPLLLSPFGYSTYRGS